MPGLLPRYMLSQSQGAGLLSELLNANGGQGLLALEMVDPIRRNSAMNNIDLSNRPTVYNRDGSVSSIRSMSFQTPDGEVLVPTVSERGQIMTGKEARQQYARTGKHLGIFPDVQSADEGAEYLHDLLAGRMGVPDDGDYPSETRYLMWRQHRNANPHTNTPYFDARDWATQLATMEQDGDTELARLKRFQALTLGALGGWDAIHPKAGQQR